MKTCRFCAEEIQDAAIVCKHCGRDLVAPASSPAAKRPTRWGRVLLILCALGGVFFALIYFGEDHQRYLVFSAARDAWHRKCDVYTGKPVTTPAARDCAEELSALMAQAKREGWR
jgi:hypothetical protein